MQAATLCLAHSALTLTMAVPSAARSELLACPTHRSTEQGIARDGALRQDDCRVLSIAPTRRKAGALGVIDVSGTGFGLAEAPRDVAPPQQWRLRCDRLAASGG